MKKLFMRVLIVCSLGAIASTAQAGLTHVNDDAFAALVLQENEVTRDSATNLDWLDIDAYAGKSWTEMDSTITPGLIGSGILADWRHATIAEVEVYFANLGLETGAFPNTTSDPDGGVHGVAASLFTGVSHTLNKYVYGATATTLNGGSNVKSAFFYFNADKSDTSTNSRSVGYSNSHFGHWLVRTSPSESVVPEPSTFSMLAFGCIAMAGYTRLRRRRK